MYKLDFEKAEEPVINCQCPFDHRKSKGISGKKKSTFASLTMLMPVTVRITTNLWKILHKMGLPTHCTCLLRNLYAGQEAKVRTRHGTTDWFKIGKGVRQGCILSPLLNLPAEYIMRNAGLDEAQAFHKMYSAYKLNKQGDNIQP